MDVIVKYRVGKNVATFRLPRTILLHGFSLSNIRRHFDIFQQAGRLTAPIDVYFLFEAVFCFSNGGYVTRLKRERKLWLNSII